MAVAKKIKTDPELIRQIEAAKSGDELIGAVFSLDLPMKKLLDPEVVEKVSHELIDRVAEEAGLAPKDVSVFRNLGTFAVSASPRFIRKMIDTPGIAKAVANDQSATNKKFRY